MKPITVSDYLQLVEHPYYSLQSEGRGINPADILLVSLGKQIIWGSLLGTIIYVKPSTLRIHSAYTVWIHTLAQPGLVSTSPLSMVISDNQPTNFVLPLEGTGPGVLYATLHESKPEALLDKSVQATVSNAALFYKEDMSWTS